MLVKFEPGSRITDENSLSLPLHHFIKISLEMGRHIK